ncbi:hypothetical protein [Lutispora sp.]|uniref:hypothetical protein n=1 Tax=Lutispora sp. TaxID=2828727 RepID=UPI002B20A1F8|nr:hypothetical protein [Lutispora sp.]MEA4963821.1 hypothetical protein [Lutispora sp.]
MEAKRTVPNARYGAMVIVVKDGRIEFMSLNASTLPDDPGGYHKDAGATNLKLYPETKGKVATVKEGVYYFNEVLHGRTKYPALQINNSGIVPATRAGLPDTVADGVHIHRGSIKSDSLVSPTSLSCLTIHPDDYADFGDIVGFAKGGRVNAGDPKYAIKGRVVIDRSFMK